MTEGIGGERGEEKELQPPPTLLALPRPTFRTLLGEAL